MITKTNCECCEAITYHIELDGEALSIDEDQKLEYHLTREEMQDLYFQLKEELLHGDN